MVQPLWKTVWRLLQKLGINLPYDPTIPLPGVYSEKTTMRYHFMPVRLFAIQKSTSNKCWRGCGEKGTLLHCWWEFKLMLPLWKTARRFLKKLKRELPCGPTIPLLGKYPDKILIQKNASPPMFIALLFTIVKT